MKKDLIVLKNSLITLARIGIWPKKSTLASLKSHFAIGLIVILFSIVMLPAGIISHLVLTIKEKMYSEIVLNLSETFGSSSTGYIMFYFIIRAKHVLEFYYILMDDSKFGKSPYFDEINTKYNSYSKMYSSYLYMAVNSYGIITILVGAHNCKKANLTREYQDVCGFFVSFYVPYLDYGKYPLKAVIIFMQAIATNVLMIGGLMVCFTILECAQLIKSKFLHLGQMIIETFQSGTDAEKRFKMKQCIRYHNEIIRQAQLFNDVYAPINFIHILMTSLTLGTLEYEYLMRHSVPCLLHFIAWVVGLYVDSFAGQVLSNASCDDLCADIYKSNWYNAPLDVQFDLKMFIQRAQRPIYLKAGPIGQLSLELFLKVVKTGFSYFTLLNNLQ